MSVSEVDDFLLSWIINQISAVGEQTLSLVLSALLGGVISWAITGWFERKAGLKQAEIDKKHQREQQKRDQRRNLFEYRHWRTLQSSATQKQWDVSVDTSPWYRYNWVLSAKPKFQERITSVRFMVESMIREKESVELTDEFASRSQNIPPLGVSWVVDRHGLDKWKLNGDGDCFFVFDIGRVIDDADRLVIEYELESGKNGYEHHFFSPFDSMKDYRPWEEVSLEKDG